MGNGVLIVDDAAFMRMMIKEILSRNDVPVAGEAENGAVAVKRYVELKPDLVIMDITMPEMSGIEALRQIRQIDGSAKVIICSALGQQDMVVEAIQYGARDFIVKPFQENRLVQAIRKCM
jgi:two-component system chemotaxis response regulator CheY